MGTENVRYPEKPLESLAGNSKIAYHNSGDVGADHLPDWLPRDLNITTERWNWIIGASLSDYYKQGLPFTKIRSKARLVNASDMYVFLEQNYPEKLERMQAFFDPDMQPYIPRKRKNRLSREKLAELSELKGEFHAYLRSNPNSTPEDWANKGYDVFKEQFYLNPNKVLENSGLSESRIRDYYISFGLHFVQNISLWFFYKNKSQGMKVLSPKELDSLKAIGLIEAIDKYDSSITNLQHYLQERRAWALNSGNLESNMIRLPIKMNEMLFNFLSGITALESALGRKPTMDEILENLNIDVGTFERLRSIDRIANGLQLRNPSFFDTLPAENPDVDEKIYKEQLELIFREKVFPNLSERESKILKLRHGFYDKDLNPDAEEHTLEGIGKKIGLSKQGIEYIETKAMAKAKVILRFRLLD